jgi:ABC-type iron transport system FetAB ATPase subunit
MFAVHDLIRNGLPPVSFELQAGELVCLSGPSGCGKTLLLRALVDLDINRGTVSLRGEERGSMTAQQWRRRVALLPAESRWWAATVGEHFTHLDEVQARQLGFEPDVSRWRIERLSSGEKQRLALLRLLTNRPEVLLLDEPTANLDAENGLRVEHLIKDYLVTQQACCLWVSHNVQQVQRLCTRQLTMKVDGLLEAA